MARLRFSPVWCWAGLWLLLLTGCEGLLELEDKTFDCTKGAFATTFDGSNAGLWDYEPGDGNIDFEDGVLNLYGPAEGIPATVFIDSKFGYDFTGVDLRVRIVKRPSLPRTAELILYPSGDLDSGIFINADDTVTRISMMIDGQFTSDNASSDLNYIRVVEQDGLIDVQLSADGSDYQSAVQPRARGGMALENMKISLRLLADAGDAGELAQFDDLTTNFCAK